MGMDVIGKSGNYFRNTWWSWRPLAHYCFSVAPHVCERSNHQNFWQYNEGSMTRKEATILASILQANLDSGHTAKFEREWREKNASLPDEECRVCKGRGLRQERTGPGGVVINPGSIDSSVEPWICNACHGAGKVRPPSTHYPFSEANVRKWVEFLRASDGFELH